MEKKMTAAEARKKTDQANLVLAEAEFSLCLGKIDEAVSQGNYYADMSFNGNLYPSTIKQLSELGYKVQGGTRISWGKEK